MILGLACLATLAGRAGDLPTTPYAVRVDGDPREAFLLGAQALPAFDAITGHGDGGVRAYALATKEGLYVALLSTEPQGTRPLTVPAPGSAPTAPPGESREGTGREFLGPPVKIGPSTADDGAPPREPAAQPPPERRHPEFLGPPVKADEPPAGGLQPKVGVGSAATGSVPSAPTSMTGAPSWRTTPDAALAGDWMAVRVQGPYAALFLLTSAGATVSIGEDGGPSSVSDLGWMAAFSTFGHTWAGEWLLPWKTLGLAPGEGFRLSVLRGRKLVAQGTALEVLATTAPGQSGERWGGDGESFSMPRSVPEPMRTPRGLAPYEVRPFVPPAGGVAACEDAAPAGEVVTAWLELPPAKVPWTVRAEGWPGGAEVFRVDFWWQAGVREEQDALFPARVASGAGDLLVAERLLPQPAHGMAPSPWPVRVYVRARLGKAASPGTLERTIDVSSGDRLVASLPWKIRVAPPLPASRRMAGLYYSEERRGRWEGDFADMATHGIGAVTCPVRDPEAARRFVASAKASGLEGDFFLQPGAGTPRPGWAYVADEPSTAAAVEAARARAERLRAEGFRTWAALAWPVSLSLARDLDGAAFAPNLLEPAARAGLTSGRWTYFQGLREDPVANRVSAGLLAFAHGLSGFWVFCYASGDEGETDWNHPFLRHDALVENGPSGTRVQTVEWEALREGILDGRLREALGEKTVALDARFPEVREVLAGRDWRLDRTRWDAAAYRAALVAAWRGAP